ncbi:hypothetical protein Pla52o_24700 [Novipirellula galeiformis]|uniref:Heparinase II/III-like protein n=1 Tax=Novipirellula galeiformis TaxID=2528004 RepID=A0A5C6CGT1_9BACT|nr:hypothetical protein [Novipirellula galeiformis]TWU22937.1 hypothetical protein Pla52o_24700 [Novipirellula galeiformis]
MSTKITEAENALNKKPAPRGQAALNQAEAQTKSSSMTKIAVPDDVVRGVDHDGGERLPNGDRVSEANWETLCKKFAERGETKSAKKVFGPAAVAGTVYRWGLATSIETAVDPVRQGLSQMACDQPPRRRGSTRPVDWVAATAEMIVQLDHGDRSVISCHDAILWAGAMPMLSQHLEPALWWELLGSLQQFREGVLQTHRPDSPAHLIVGAELGLTLAWRLADLPSCKRAQKSAIDALALWCDHEDEAIPAVLAKPAATRLVLGSLLRCQELLKATTKKTFLKSWTSIGDQLATWVAAMTTHHGTSAFSPLTRKEVKDDRGQGGLLEYAMAFDPETLRPATEAALGLSHSGGRLAWEVCLPDAFHHCEDAKLAIMLPEWDVRRGRTHLSYRGEHNELEIYAGRTRVVSGTVQTSIEIDGVDQQPSGDWSLVCEYTDDDVHFIEIEQPWTGGVVLQRQLMLIRDDRCLMMADGVLPCQDSESDAATPLKSIRYSTRIPVAAGISAELENETRELFLSDGQPRALVMPLSASEWRIGPTTTKLSASEDDHLVWTAQGNGALYMPLWFDLQQRRFRRKRTWRQLTVGDERRLCDRHEAVGFRVQVGSEQWMIYRSLGQRRCRTVLGKHLIADFFAARFDTGEGDYDELVTVDDSEANDD